MTNDELAKLLKGFRSANDALIEGLESLMEGDDEDADDDVDGSEEEDDGEKTRSKKPAGKPARSSTPAADASQVLALRTACKKNGRGAEFDALEKSGATIQELRALLTASVRTTATEIDGTQKPAAGKRSGLIRLEDTPAGKRKAK